jgi:AcrR family transcriptional regulator
MAEAVTERPRERRRRMRQQRVERILDAAVSVFAERGFHDASMDEIAERAAVSKPVLYTHFESKDGLYQAILEQSARLMSDGISRAVEAAGTPEERVWAGIVAFLDIVDNHRDWWIASQKAAVAGEPFASAGRRVNATMAALIENLAVRTAAESGIGGDALAALEPLAHAFVGACEKIAFWWVAHPEVPKGNVAVQLMNMLWMGFGNLLEANIWLPPQPLKQ